jgi:hypothetical protein
MKMFDFLKNIYDTVVNGPVQAIEEFKNVTMVDNYFDKTSPKQFLTERDIPEWIEDVHVYNCGWIDENSKLMKKAGKKDSGFLLLEISSYDSANNKRSYHPKN